MQGYLRKKGMEFFGCGRGKGVSLPTAEGAGSFLVTGRGRESLYLPPRGREFFGYRQGEGVSLPTAAGGREQKNAHPASGIGGGGLLRAYNWSEADTIRTQCGWVK